MTTKKEVWKHVKTCSDHNIEQAINESLRELAQDKGKVGVFKKLVNSAYADRDYLIVTLYYHIRYALDNTSNDKDFKELIYTTVSSLWTGFLQKIEQENYGEAFSRRFSFLMQEKILEICI
ncbi:MAG: hypothetical protein GXP45_01620 [bacterium]|nr:hypothetical protein [bacterium]